MDEIIKCPECGARVDVKPFAGDRLAAECSFCSWKALRDEDGDWYVLQ
jgi:uncharacterized paraquat-inducible protein A